MGVYGYEFKLCFCRNVQPDVPTCNRLSRYTNIYRLFLKENAIDYAEKVLIEK